MSVFYSAAAALTKPILEDALEQTLRVIAEELRLDAAWVWLLDEHRNAFYLAASYDLPPYLREPLHMTGEPCWCMRAFYEGEFISRNVDVITCSRLQEGLKEAGPGATRGLRSHASIALRFGDHALGLLNAARAQQPAISAGELETLATIGAQIGVAVERARLAERTSAAARIEERVALARELHDTIVQDLTAISLHLEGAAGKISSDPAKANDRIAIALELTRSALDDLRRNVDGLRNDPLNGEPLISALSQVARRMTSETGIQVVLHGVSPPPSLPAEVEFSAFRIASEALTNVQRHAEARRVDISLEIRAGELALSIRDDGRGFEPATLTGGFGLVGMRERAEALGGRVQVHSSRDVGTTVAAALPLIRK